MAASSHSSLQKKKKKLCGEKNTSNRKSIQTKCEGPHQT